MARSPDCALIFPGQGAHDPAMLDAVRGCPSFAARARAFRDILGFEADARVLLAGEGRHDNLRSSALTVLASVVALDAYLETHDPPGAFAGYSVGQWTALYAAGALSFDTLIGVVQGRSACMDASVARRPGGMVGLVGTPLARLQDFCGRLREQGHEVFISNYNAPGQYSLAGTVSGIEAVMADAAELAAKRVVRLPVSGPWHSPLLLEAAEPFSAFLARVDLAPPDRTVIDNVTGEPLVEAPEGIRAQLVRHLFSPVRWDAGIRALAARQVTTFVEAGYGSMLSRFGFFIDRRALHVTFPKGQAG